MPMRSDFLRTIVKVNNEQDSVDFVPCNAKLFKKWKGACVVRLKVEGFEVREMAHRHFTRTDANTGLMRNFGGSAIDAR